MLTGAIVGALVGLVFTLMATVSKKRAQQRRLVEGPPVPPPVHVPAGYGTVIVRRLSVGMAGAKLTFDVLADDVARGQLSSHTAVAIPVPPGPHAVRVSRGRMSSPVLSFDMPPGGSVILDCEYEQGAFSGRIALNPAA